MAEMISPASISDDGSGFVARLNAMRRASSRYWYRSSIRSGRMFSLSKVTLLMCLTLCLLACTQPGSTNNNVVAGSRSESYGHESAALMEAKARSGDGHAQALVENHYREIGKAAMYRQWMEEWVSRGDLASMQRLASHLIPLGGIENWRRA
ncbi:TPA: hypothetical protein ACOFBV_002174 [Stenotrophomonas maltophilia]|uniref:hypothetical protein n=2 Tax=Stenotrophomonas maltophilia TaxID=40324 RepID=UPI0039C08C3D